MENTVHGANRCRQEGFLNMLSQLAHVTQLHCWVFGSVVQDEVQDAIAAAQLKDLMKETDVSFKTKHNQKGVENMSINSQV